jgi:uncharacterized protein (DUF4415 family)
MTKVTITTWPSFVTKDLGDSPEDEAEMQRRWEIYDREMKAIIAAGTAHQDEDGWWVDTATGELIGPDPEIERPWTEEDFARAKRTPMVLPEAIAAIRRARGPTRTKEAISIRLDMDLVEKLRATGPGWQSRVNDALREWLEKSAA